MQAIKNILVCTDFSEPSENALAYALDLAEQLTAHVYVLHAFVLPVLGFPDGVLVPTAEMSAAIVTDAQNGLDDAIARARDRKVAVEALLKQGDPREIILSVADEKNANLIVMGTHGRRGIARALIGSVTESVVRTSPVPVLTVH